MPAIVRYFAKISHLLSESSLAAVMPRIEVARLRRRHLVRRGRSWVLGSCAVSGGEACHSRSHDSIGEK